MTVRWLGLKGCAAALAVAVSATLLVASLPVPTGILEIPNPINPTPQTTLVKYEWKDAPSLIVPRASPAVVTLKDGNILVIGGTTASGSTATTEVFDVKASAWKLGPTMNVKRVGMTATLLRDGTVLVVGGDTGVGATASAEILNVTSGAASVVPSMTFARSGHAAVLLGNGKVLVTGGSDWVTGNWKQAEIFDPATLRWTPAGGMSTPRLFFAMHPLAEGNAVVIGGDTSGTSEIYVSTSNSWTGVSKMTVPRFHFASTAVSGKILVAGGMTTDVPMMSSEVFDPMTNSWKAVASMSYARAKFSLEPLLNGDLVAPGSSSKLGSTSSSEVFHQSTSTWQTNEPMKTSRGAYGSATLPGGGVIVIGGRSGATVTSSVEIYSPVQSNTGKLCKPIDLVPLVEYATELPGQSSKGLIAKLVAAQAKYDAQDFEVCLNIMHAFDNQVHAFAQNGHLEPAHANEIFDGYASVIECINELRPWRAT